MRAVQYISLVWHTERRELTLESGYINDVCIGWPQGRGVGCNMRKIWVFGGGLVLACLAWNAVVFLKQQDLRKRARPFLAACQGAAGCIEAPPGWVREPGGDYSSDDLTYRASRERFELRRPLGSELWLMARGGRGEALTLERVME